MKQNFSTFFWTRLFWPLYFLQQENYNLGRFWSSFPSNVLPKKARQNLVWTKKLTLIFALSFIFSAIAISYFLQLFFFNDLSIIIGYLVNFGVETVEQFLVSQIFILAISLFFNLFLFPIWQSLFYTFTVIILSPVDNFLKNQICQKASTKVKLWQKNS